MAFHNPTVFKMTLRQFLSETGLGWGLAVAAGILTGLIWWFAL